MSFFKLLFPVVLAFASAGAWAQDLAFDQLTEAEAEAVIEELSGNFTFTSVSGASPLGSVFGVQVAAVAGITKTDEIAKLAKEASAGADADSIPHGGILAMISVPFGITAEASIIPKVGAEDFKFKNMGLAAKWSLTSGLIELPFSLAVKAHMMKTDLTFKQNVGGVDATIDFENTTMGAMVLVSKDLMIIEPYVGVGVVKGDGDFSVAGTNQFFASGTQSFSSDGTGTQLLAGVEANLLILKAGAEVSNQFGVTRFSVKAGFSF